MFTFHIYIVTHFMIEYYKIIRAKLVEFSLICRLNWRHRAVNYKLHKNNNCTSVNIFWILWNMLNAKGSHNKLKKKICRQRQHSTSNMNLHLSKWKIKLRFASMFWLVSILNGGNDIAIPNKHKKKNKIKFKTRRSKKNHVKWIV